MTERGPDGPGTVARRHGPRLHGWRTLEGIEQGGPVNTIPTAREAREEAADMGLEGEALELYVRAGAEERHDARVTAALHALLDEGERMRLDGQVTAEGVAPDERIALPEDVDGLAPVAFVRDAAAALVLGLLDAVGVGGTLGATGDGTRRIPPLARLGKGRKQASDGGAWSSAIRAAVYRLRTSLGVREVCPTDDRVGFEVHLSERGDRYCDVTILPVYNSWANAAARAAICSAANPKRFHLPEPMSGAGISGYPARWSHILAATKPDPEPQEAPVQASQVYSANLFVDANGLGRW